MVAERDTFPLVQAMLVDQCAMVLITVVTYPFKAHYASVAAYY